MHPRFHVATPKELFAVARDAGTWTLGPPAFLADPVSAVLDDPRDGTRYAALNLGHFGVKLKRSRDDGRTWEEIPPPVYPRQPDDASGSPWSLSLIWCLEAGGADQPGTLWAGTIPGGLFRSDDRGESWHLVRSLWDRPERAGWFGGGYDHPGIHSIAVDPRDSRHVTVGISCGGVWTTRDGGTSWRLTAAGMRAGYMPPDQSGNPNIQDPHRLVACRDHPDVLWAQHHSGMFRSTDGADTWIEITGVPMSSFGFAAAAHPADPDTAWFVPAVRDECRVPVDGRFVVTRTRDGGRHFDVLERGLPAAPAYDLAYRHGLDVARDGRTLALGTTTGGLWVSEDAGDTWHCISAHLPPIYAVRFTG